MGGGSVERSLTHDPTQDLGIFHACRIRPLGADYLSPMEVVRMKPIIIAILSILAIACAEQDREETRDCYKTNATGAWAQIGYFPEENGMIKASTFDDACQVIIDVYESNEGGQEEDEE